MSRILTPVTALATLPAPPPRSPAEQVAAELARSDEHGLPPSEEVMEQRWRDIIARHPDPDSVLRAWRGWWARPEQLSPGSVGAALDVTMWRWWAIVTGRGWGKTRTAAEWVVDRCEQFAAKGVRHRVALVAPTAGDARDTMVEGESGLLAVLDRRGYRYDWIPSKRRLFIYVNPKRPTRCTLYSAERPDRLRGPQHHTAWCEEYAAWPAKVDSHGNTAFTNAEFGLRLPCPPGLRTQGVVTTTPKPIPSVKDLLERDGKDVVRTRGALYDNLRNLDPEFVQTILDRYPAGSPLALQEVFGQLLDIVEGALWTPDVNNRYRVDLATIPELATPAALQDENEWARVLLDALGIELVVVGVDPFGGGRTGEAGIIAVGANLQESKAYTLEDASGNMPADVWAAEVVRVYRRWGAAFVAAEQNYGGDMVRANVHAIDSTVAVQMVHAKKSKRLRAEPVSTLAVAGRSVLVGYFPELESQMVGWVPPAEGERAADSPDRLDAHVYGVTGVFPNITQPPATASRARRAGAAWRPGASGTRGVAAPS